MEFKEPKIAPTADEGVDEVDLGVDLYSMNKNLVKQEIPLAHKEIRDTLDELMIPFVKKYTTQSYFMLLCREKYDFTLFHYDNKKAPTLHKGRVDLYECLINRGKTVSIELTSSKDALEIWINADGDSSVYYFFPYDAGVIEVKEK